MYIPAIIGLMLIFPIASIVFEVLMQNHGVLDASIVGKWFVFWAVGVRLLLAGLRQIARPCYTAETIFGIKDPDALFIVRELGFANAAIGVAGVTSAFLAGWIFPVAVIGTIFYGLAGINHATHRSRNTLQNVAMISDLFAAAVLLTFCLARLGFGLRPI
jgi:hypothetical protein